MNYLEVLGYDPRDLKRELTENYISATKEEINEMLKTLSLDNCSQLFDHISEDVKFPKTPDIVKKYTYDELIIHIKSLSEKNKSPLSFKGDGIKNYEVPDIVSYVSNIRGLTTAYTPYQPERSQGTLQTLWLYSSALKAITGFEAINAGFYDRSTCLYEAINTAKRIHKKGKTAFVLDSIYPGDKEVLNTLIKHTDLDIVYIQTNPKTGIYDQEDLSLKFQQYQNSLICVAFPQINCLGNLEDVNQLTDFCSDHHLQSIAIIDPLTLGEEGLLAPSNFGSNDQGCHMIVGEGQHLALKPNYGGPGLGIFGIRYNEANKTAIRSSAGRYVGKAKDQDGKDALCMVLSTREQHIRKEKATSNICSNQSFVSTIVGAALLFKGSEGLKETCITTRKNALYFYQGISKLKGIELTFPKTAFFNELCLTINENLDELKLKSKQQNIQLGVFVNERINSSRPVLLISFFDSHDLADIDKLIGLFKEVFREEEKEDNVIINVTNIPTNLKRHSAINLPRFSNRELEEFYTELGQQNVSPDDNIYPLGSCTMKYNPYINDWAASLPGFTDIHPQSDDNDAQGSLEILYGVQEMFTVMTGLKGTTTQPVAGAQGELVGLKMFQAYHKDRNEGQQRDIILIPRSAHGTNPATATMAGYQAKNLKIIEATKDGRINIQQLKDMLAEYPSRIAGIMVTNPNTSGIFESRFKEMAELIHQAGGLVYMDGANMNAIAGIVNLGALGVDAVHNNLHKTWTIPHGGGGPGDAIVAVSEKLYHYLPGVQVKFENGVYKTFKTQKTIGSFHRHYGNFAHKIRCYAYLLALGSEGIRTMSEVAVLSARYLYHQLKDELPSLPEGADHQPRMHEFILTLTKEHFNQVTEVGIPKAQTIAKVGKLFLDFGLHAPTVAFPEIFGLMIEPTESFSKSELDHFVTVVKSIKNIISETPEVLKTVPHFTPVAKVDEVNANKNLILYGDVTSLPSVLKNKIAPGELDSMDISTLLKEIIAAHKLSLEKLN
jgi:glycine dehydrogenase